MSDQQLPTGINDPYDSLQENQKIAVDMRLEFFKYKHIAAKLQLQEQTVREWFMEGKPTKISYEYRASLRALENEQMVKFARQELASLIPEAILTIKGAMSKGNANIAIEVLGLNGMSVGQDDPTNAKNKEKLVSFSNLIDNFTSHVRRLTDPSNQGTT